MDWTNLFPLVSLLTVVSTNWVNISGDVRIEGKTNSIHQRLVVVTNIYVQEVSLCTNRTLYKRTEGPETNAPTRWLSLPLPLPIPGQLSKE